MAEKILEKETCQTCGANVRMNAEFCYNCGSAVRKNVESNTPHLTVGELLKKNIEIEENRPNVTSKLDEKKILVSSAPEKMKSAADLHQKTKPERKKTVEVSWEEPESAPNIWFISVTFILTLFAVGILFLMLYIR